MAEYITASAPAAWESLGTTEVPITTQGVSIASAVEALGVAAGDFVRVSFQAAGDMIMASTWSNSGYYVRTRTSGTLADWTGYWGDSPVTFIAKSATETLALHVERFKASA